MISDYVTKLRELTIIWGQKGTSTNLGTENLSHSTKKKTQILILLLWYIIHATICNKEFINTPLCICTYAYTDI